MSDRLVLVTTRSFGSGSVDPAAPLEEAGFRVERGDPGHDLDELAPILEHAEGWIAGTGRIASPHFDAAPRLRIVARYGVGVDNVDLRAAADHGVLVTNTPAANADAVADHAIGLMLAALRHVVAGDAAVRAGDWSSRRGRELGECTVGIVGYGTIGRAVRRRLAGFDADVIAHDPYIEDADVPLAELEELLGRADVITLHAPPGDTPLLDEARLRRVRAAAVIVNTARAGLVDGTAVAQALHDGRLAAFASDVLDPAAGGTDPLLGAPRTIFTPHVAGQTTRAVDRMGTAAVTACIHVLVEDRVPEHLVDPRGTS